MPPVPPSAAEAVADRLLELIRADGLGPGDRLPVERDLAASLGVARSTVREAIRSLSSKGLLSARQGSGTYITDMSPETLAGPLMMAVERSHSAITTLMDVRAMLEAGAAELAATNATKRDVASLRRLNARISEVPDAPRMLDADRAFHRRIHELSGNELLAQLLESIWHLARGKREQIMAQHDLLARTLDGHERIIEAIASGDPGAARRAMRDHVDDIRGWLHRAVGDAAE